MSRILKKQTILVTLHNGRVVKEQITSPLEDAAIQFTLNSKYGHQGWKTYKIKTEI